MLTFTKKLRPSQSYCEVKADVRSVPEAVLGDNQDLRQFIEAVGAQAQPLVLTQADRRQPAGALCAVDAGRAQLWDFTPLAASNSAPGVTRSAPDVTRSAPDVARSEPEAGSYAPAGCGFRRGSASARRPAVATERVHHAP